MIDRLRSFLSTRWLLILLALLPVVAFGMYLSHPFMTLDDDYLIYANPAIKVLNGQSLLHVFSRYDPQLYIPFTFLSWQLTHALAGFTPFFYHAGNLVLHAANAILLFLIFQRLTRNRLLAFFAASLFAIHPLQTEVVLWAAARKDALSGFFVLSSLLAALKYRDGDDSRWYWASVGLFACGLLSKVSVIMMPAILFLVDRYEGRTQSNQTISTFIPYVLLAMLFAIVAVIGKTGVIGSSGLAMDVFLPSKSTLFYLWKIAWPVNFSVIYPQNELLSLASPVLLATVAAAVFLGLIGFITMWKWPRSLFAFCVLWYILWLLPSYSTFLKNGFLYFASDRYAYLASAGIFLLIAWVVQKLVRSNAKAMLGLNTLLIIGLVALSIRQGAAWKNSEAMYRNVLQIYPNSAMAHSNLGMEMEEANKREEAMSEYRKAIAIAPHQSIPYFNLAADLGKEGKYDEQLKTYQTIVDVLQSQEIGRPSELQRFFWLEQKFDQLGKSEDALRLLEKLVEVAPSFADPHAHLADRYLALGKRSEAFAQYVLADEAGTRDPKVYYHLAELFSEQGQDAEVIRVLEKGVMLDPTNQVAKSQLEQLKLAQ